MNRSFLIVFLLTVSRACCALNPDEWQFRQVISIPSTGLVSINLPAQTLNSVREDFADLRVVIGRGQEVPYLIDQRLPTPALTSRPKEFRAEIIPSNTRLVIKTGTDSPLVGIRLTVPPGAAFTKAVRIEGSRDDVNWQTLTSGDTIFRTSSGDMNLRVRLPESAWKALRITVDDSRTEPIPFTDAELVVAESRPPIEGIPVTTQSRDESPGSTRIGLDLGAANLRIESLHIETEEPLFTRHITVAAPALSGDKLEEELLGTAVIYRVQSNGKAEARLDVPMDRQVRGRELILTIENGDSPPLAIDSITADRRVTRLLFFVSDPGQLTLLSGNSQCAPPRYDIAELKGQLQHAVANEATLTGFETNPAYHLSLPVALGGKIDISPWKFRKPLQVAASGPQEVELDLNVLARSGADLRDVRLIQGDTQLPFLFLRTSIMRSVGLMGESAPDRDHPKMSRWSINLPEPAAPLTRLSCKSDSALFERNVRAWEELRDARGETYPRELGRAAWRRVPGDPPREFTVQIDARPQGDTVFLETDNGDNAAIELHDFRGYYNATRIMFDAPTSDQIWLYYGHPDASVPHYDARLIVDRLLRAQRTIAKLGPEQKLVSDRIFQTLTGSVRYIFWAALSLVVIALLWLISRLLPSQSQSS